MRRVYLTLKLAMTAFLLSYSSNSFSQTYSAWSTGTAGAYDAYTAYSDTMRFTFTGLPPGAFGMAKLVVYFEGDYGDAGEIATNFLAATTTGPNISMVGLVDPSAYLNDCAPEDSVVLMFNTSLIVPLGSSIAFKSIPSNTVDPSTCTTIRTRMRLEFDYCAFGTPAAYAHAIVSDNEVCPSDVVTLSGTPAGGTFSGPGVSGTTFNPNALAPGIYTITYEATDGIGCTTTDDTTIRIMNSPQIDDYIVCFGDTANIVPNSGASFIYFSDAGLTDPLDTTLVFDYGPLMASETLYVQTNDADFSFGITSLLSTPAVIVDHGTLAGDDRGGIAITPNYVYVNGDGAVARFNTSLAAATGIACPQRDGLFSDLASGTLYTLWNTTTSAAPSNPGTYTVNAFMELNDMLAFTGNVMELSQPIPLNSGSSIYAGAGILILFNVGNSHFYVIDINTGDVTDMGVATANPTPYATEVWLRWGVAEYDGTNYHVVYRNTSGSFISRMNITTGAVTTVATFSSLGDMASITYSPWENKWYWKYEGSGGMWGGTTETLGKLDGAHNLALVSSGGIGCYSDVVLTVPEISIGTDQTFCQGDAALFNVGLGYSSISWNGNNSDLNTYEVTSSQTVIIEAVEASTGCTVRDTAMATMNPLPAVTLNLTDDHACNNQSAFALTGGSPSGGTFSGGFVTGSSFNATSAGMGTHIVTYTFTDGNGCTNQAQDAVFVDACAGVNEVESDLVAIYPNPASNNLIIDGGTYTGQLVSIDVYDAQGRLVLSEKATLGQNHQFNVSALYNGVYQLVLSVDEKRSVNRLVIQK